MRQVNPRMMWGNSSADTTPSSFVLEDAEWGSYLAYGPKGIRKEALSPEAFGLAEFAGDGSAGHDHMAVTAILGAVVEETKEETISDAFVNMVIMDNIVGVVAGGATFRVDPKTMQAYQYPNALVENGKLFIRNADGSRVKLRSIRDYVGFGNLEI